MRIRLLCVLALFALVIVGAVPVDAGRAKAPPAAKPAPLPRVSKLDLAAYYKPDRLHGLDWYARIGAARYKNIRLRAAGEEERPILQLRALGPITGNT